MIYCRGWLDGAATGSGNEHCKGLISSPNTNAAAEAAAMNQYPRL